MATRIVSFGGSSVQINYEGSDAAKVVNFLYQDIPSDENAHAHITFQLRSEQGVFVLHCGKARRYEGRSAAAVAGILLDESSFHLADMSRHGLLLHAGAVRFKGGCLLLPGKTGAGKTTLTAWLTKKGLGYLTDELVYIPLGSQDVQSLGRPLNIKTAARRALAEAIDFDAAADHLIGPNATLIRSTSLDPRPVLVEAARLALIAFPRYQAGSQFQWRRLTKAQTALRLTECLINARNLPAHGFHEVARLARVVRSSEMRYSDFRQLEAWVDLLMSF